MHVAIWTQYTGAPAFVGLAADGSTDCTGVGSATTCTQARVDFTTYCVTPKFASCGLVSRNIYPIDKDKNKVFWGFATTMVRQTRV